ncbi:uncharacterized protein LOC143376856 isoform X2 [Andrena cerasifolii]
MADGSLPEQFSLKWNNFSSNLTSGFLSHLTENDLVDVTLAVEGQLLQAHKLVLSVCSPYFKSIFKENPCQHPVVILKDMKYTEIESLLKFMYQGEINIRKEDLSTFLKVAQTLQIRGLATEDASSARSFSNEEDPLSIDFDPRGVPPPHLINKVGKDVEMIDRRKRSREISKRSVKKRKQDTLPGSENVHDLSNEEADDDKKNVLLLMNKDTNDCVHENEDTKIPIVKSDDDNQKVASPGDAQSSSENPTQQGVEPVIYRLSARGRPQLVHEGYVYNLTSRSEGLNRSHYRCAEQHRGCKGCKHFISKIERRPDRKQVRKRCSGCYEGLRESGLHWEDASKKTRKVNTECKMCNKVFCMNCFEKYHS